MYLHKTPRIVKKIFPELVWSKTTARKEVYLTFDDGPVPEITEFVIELLKQYEASATFFCVGHNVQKHPEVFQSVVESGFSVGNHTFHHLNAWKTTSDIYLKDLKDCAIELNLEYGDSKALFRPPYGRVTRKIVQAIATQYEIIMWDNLTGDFDQTLHPETCFKRAIENTTPGSIVTFHDSVKAARNLRFVLPRYLDHFVELGYSFKAL